jgi:hypothetical protein
VESGEDHPHADEGAEAEDRLQHADEEERAEGEAAEPEVGANKLADGGEENKELNLVEVGAAEPGAAHRHEAHGDAAGRDLEAEERDAGVVEALERREADQVLHARVQAGRGPLIRVRDRFLNAAAGLGGEADEGGVDDADEGEEGVPGGAEVNLEALDAHGTLPGETAAQQPQAVRLGLVQVARVHDVFVPDTAPAARVRVREQFLAEEMGQRDSVRVRLPLGRPSLDPSGLVVLRRAGGETLQCRAWSVPSAAIRRAA